MLIANACCNRAIINQQHMVRNIGADMPRRSRVSSESSKLRRGKAASVLSHSSAAGAESENARLSRELHEAREQQAATALENTRLLNELQQRTDDFARSVDELRALGEVSKAVNSTLELDAVLSTIVAKAVQLSRT